MCNMKVINIIIILTFSVFLVSEFSFCNIAKADGNDEHCVGCCSLGCCLAITPSNQPLINITTISKIFCSQVSFPQSFFSKGLERPPRISHR